MFNLNKNVFTQFMLDICVKVRGLKSLNDRLNLAHLICFEIKHLDKSPI